MPHDLKLIDGGGSCVEVTPFRRQVGNVIQLLPPARVAPSEAQILDMLRQVLTGDLLDFAEAFVPVFLEMCGESWGRSMGGIGLVVSQSTAAWEPDGKLRPPSRMGIPEPDWSMTVRGWSEGVRYHLHLPPHLGKEVVVPVGRMEGEDVSASGLRHLVTFRRACGTWEPVAHEVAKLRKKIDDHLAVSPFLRAYQQPVYPCAPGLDRA